MVEGTDQQCQTLVGTNNEKVLAEKKGNLTKTVQISKNKSYSELSSVHHCWYKSNSDFWTAIKISSS